MNYDDYGEDYDDYGDEPYDELDESGKVPLEIIADEDEDGGPEVFKDNPDFPGFIERKKIISRFKYGRYNEETLVEFEGAENTNESVLIECLPGVGRTSTVVGAYIIGELSLPLIATFSSPHITPMCTIHKNLAAPQLRIHGDKDVCVAVCDDALSPSRDPELIWNIVSALGDFARRHRCRHIVTVEAYPVKGEFQRQISALGKMFPKDPNRIELDLTDVDKKDDKKKNNKKTKNNKKKKKNNKNGNGTNDKKNKTDDTKEKSKDNKSSKSSTPKSIKKTSSKSKISSPKSSKSNLKDKSVKTPKKSNKKDDDKKSTKTDKKTDKKDDNNKNDKKKEDNKKDSTEVEEKTDVLDEPEPTETEKLVKTKKQKSERILLKDLKNPWQTAGFVTCCPIVGKELKKLGHRALKTASIIGVTGAFLSWSILADKDDPPVTAILAPDPVDIPDSRGALLAVKLIRHLFNLVELDTDNLKDEVDRLNTKVQKTIDNIKSQIGKLVEKTQPKAPPRHMYL